MLNNSSDNETNLHSPNRPDIFWSEYRFVTVLFIDIDSSTSLLNRVGAEAYQTLLTRFHNRLQHVINLHDGVIDQYQGDGAFCFFYHDTTNTDGATRAIEAVIELGGIVTNIDGQDVTFSAGMATGNALFNDSDGKAKAVGSCINLAARLTGFNAQGDFLVCPRTKLQAQRYFVFEKIENLPLKGFEGTQTAFKLLKGHHRVHEMSAQRLKNIPLLGRDTEMAQLKRVAMAVRNNRSVSTSIIGQAGIGKSKLTQSFLDHTDNADCGRMILRCRKETKNSDFGPIFNYLRWMSGCSNEPDFTLQKEKLSQLFSNVWQLDNEEIDNLLYLMGYKTETQPTSKASVLRKGLFSTLMDVISSAFKSRPMLILLVEDVQWIDPSTSEFLHYLSENSRDQPLFILSTQRGSPDDVDRLFPSTQRIFLKPLKDNDVRELVSQSVAGHVISDAAFKWICDQAKGIPFYIHQLYQYVNIMKDSAGKVIDNSDGFAGFFETRLDRLPTEAKRFIQTASVIGRRFQPDLVLEVLELSPDRLDPCLNVLHNEQLIDSAVDTENVEFTHDLVQETINKNLSTELRIQLHHRTAQAMYARGGKPAALAYHYKQSGQMSLALNQLKLAVSDAFELGALHEANQFVHDAYNWLEEVEDRDDRLPEELHFRLIEAPLEMVMGGPGNPRFGNALSRAIALMDALEQTDNVVALVYNSGLHDWACGRLDQAESIANNILSDHPKSEEALLAGNTLTGLVAWHKGENVKAQTHLSKVIACYSPERHAALFPKFLKDFGVFGLFYSALTESTLGAPDNAANFADRSYEIAQKSDIPHPMGFGLLAKFINAMLRDDLEMTLKYAVSAENLSADHSFPEFLAMSQFAIGWVTAQSAETRSIGISKMTKAFENLKQTGFVCWQGFYAGLLGDEMIRAGHLETVENMLSEHIFLCELNNEAQFLPLLYLSQAKLCDASYKPTAAFKSLEYARNLTEKHGGMLWGAKIKSYMETRLQNDA